MSVRRRRIKDRIERDERYRKGCAEFDAAMTRISSAIDAALARGETHKSPRFFVEAFGCSEFDALLLMKNDSAPSPEAPEGADHMITERDS